jgi:hypothetical protein
MVSGLGHRVVWCMVMIVLEDHSGSVFAGSRKMEAETSVPTNQFTRSHNPEDYNFES